MDRAVETEFEGFVHGSYARLLRLAYLLSGDHGHAEDAVQMALAKTAVVWPRLARNGSVYRYVQRTLVNTIISRRRLRWWSESPSLEVDSVELSDPYRRSDDRDALRRALTRLSARQRAAVVLRHYEDLSECQAAAVMGCSVGTIKSLTSRGLRQLRDDLGSRAAEVAVEQEGDVVRHGR